MEGKRVTPVAGGGAALQLVPCTLAQVSKASGYYPALAHDATARDEELLHEAAFLSHDLLVYERRPVEPTQNNLEGSWDFILSDAKLAEDSYIEDTPLADCVKMALARQLQLRDGLTNEQRNRISVLEKAVLLAQIAGGAGPALAPAPAVAAPAVPGRRGGRGRGRRGGRGGL